MIVVFIRNKNILDRNCLRLKSNVDEAVGIQLKLKFVLALPLVLSHFFLLLNNDEIDDKRR